MRAVLLTTHYWNSRKKAGFHFIAETLWKRGWEVMFFMVRPTWLEWALRDKSFQDPLVKERRQLLEVKPRFYSYVWMNPWRPVSLGHPLVNKMTTPFARAFAHFPVTKNAIEFIRGADLLVFESAPGLMLFDRVKRWNPNARCVYRVSDDIRDFRVHPVLLQKEAEIAPRFDLVSVPCEDLVKKFNGLSNVRLQHHGLDLALFDRDVPNPYHGASGPHCIFVGNSHLDCDFIERAARLFPTYQFHLIGPFGEPVKLANVHCYGLIPFSETVPFVKHADVGLNCMTRGTITDSLKIMQYTYCRLPIVASSLNRCDKPHMFFYEPGDEVSISRAMCDALAFNRARVPRAAVRSWDALVNDLLGNP